jgi:hypothetical protein
VAYPVVPPRYLGAYKPGRFMKRPDLQQLLEVNCAHEPGSRWAASTVWPRPVRFTEDVAGNSVARPQGRPRFIGGGEQGIQLGGGLGLQTLHAVRRDVFGEGSLIVRPATRNTPSP